MNETLPPDELPVPAPELTQTPAANAPLEAPLETSHEAPAEPLAELPRELPSQAPPVLSPEPLPETLPEALAEVAPEAQLDAAPPAPVMDAAAPDGEAAPSNTTAAPATAVELSPAATAQRLAELFPALFGTEPKPIKLRIQADIQQRAPGVFSRKSLSLFLHRHTTSTPYLKSLATSPTRFDLDGQPAGETAAEHRSAAVAEVARRKQLGAERRAAEREKALAARREAEQQARREQHKQQRAEQKERRQAWQQKQAEGLAADLERERQRAEGEAQTQAQRDRAALLRAYETSTLTRANFLVLKRMTSEQLDEQLALARAEAAARSGRPARP